MNIESTNVNRNAELKSTKTASGSKDSSVKFSDELKELKSSDIQAKSEDKNVSEENKPVADVMDDLNSVVKKLNQSDEKAGLGAKDKNILADSNNVINNDFNIQENKDLLPQMNSNMNFSGNGQPFSSFMNNGQGLNSEQKLSSSAKDLAEEAAIMSTMAENIALANKNEALKNSEKTVIRNEGVKKVDSRTGITTETVVKFDSVIMNQADVEVFANLVEKGSVEMNSLSSESVQKSLQVSKTLADMLAKAKETSQPLRIDFDNNISVIIRISRDGKITADFLPSSQVAEAYLKENLPLLKQRFDEKNIEYDSLNQRERQDSQREHNRKKGRNNE